MLKTSGLRVRLSADALSQDLGDELFILDMRQQRYYALDDVGARVWALLSEHGDVNRTVGQIVIEYDVDGNTAQADVDKLLTRLAEEGLVVLER